MLIMIIYCLYLFLFTTLLIGTNMFYILTHGCDGFGYFSAHLRFFWSCRRLALIFSYNSLSPDPREIRGGHLLIVCPHLRSTGYTETYLLRQETQLHSPQLPDKALYQTTWSQVNGPNPLLLPRKLYGTLAQRGMRNSAKFAH